MQVQKTVFISYRRTNIYMARAVYANLRANGYDAFLDYQSLESGDFSQSLLNQIAARAHFVVILTPSAKGEAPEGPAGTSGAGDADQSIEQDADQEKDRDKRKDACQELEVGRGLLPR